MDGWTVERFNGSVLIQEPLGTTLNLGPEKSKLLVTLRSPLDGEKWELHRRRGLNVTVEGRNRIKVGYRQRMIRSETRDQNRAIMNDWALEADSCLARKFFEFFLCVQILWIDLKNDFQFPFSIQTSSLTTMDLMQVPMQ